MPALASAIALLFFIYYLVRLNDTNYSGGAGDFCQPKHRLHNVRRHAHGAVENHAHA